MLIRITIIASTKLDPANLVYPLKQALQSHGMVERDPAPIIDVEYSDRHEGQPGPVGATGPAGPAGPSEPVEPVQEETAEPDTSYDYTNLEYANKPTNKRKKGAK